MPKISSITDAIEAVQGARLDWATDDAIYSQLGKALAILRDVKERAGIPLSECPSEIRNYFDAGPMSRRVIRVHVRGIHRRKELIGDEYVVVTTSGKVYFRQDQWGDWKIHKSSEPVSN